jgi:isopenicillin-N N-acyltransferase-like protein
MPTTRDGYRYEPVPSVPAAGPHPPHLVARARNLMRATLGLLAELGAGTVAGWRAFHEYPVHAARAIRAAEHVGVDPVELFAATLCYDQFMGTGAMGCSTLALAGPSGPVLARNMDWFPAEKVAKASCLVADEFGTNAGFVGMVGSVTGLSRRGFAACLNAALGPSDSAGYPMLLFLRHVLDTATDFAHAVELVRSERLMSCGIVTLVGATNAERAIVERTPTDARVRAAQGDRPLIATNHFRALAAPTECARFDHMARHAGAVPALDLLTNPNVLQSITAQHAVLCPAAGFAEMYVPSHLLPDDVDDEVAAADLFGFAG